MANMSFLPEDYLERRIARRTNLISLSLFVVVMGGIVAAFFVTDRERAAVRNLQYQVDAQFEEAANRLEQLDKLQVRKREMLRKAKVTAVLKERVPRSLILAELINNMPSSLSLLDLSMETRTIKVKRKPATALDEAKAKKKKKKKKKKGGDGPVAPPQPEVQPTESSLTLVGVAPTDVQVAQFMTALSRSKMFEQVNLAFSKETNMEDQTMRTFRIDMRLKSDIDVRDLSPKHVPRKLKQNPMGGAVQIDTVPMVMPEVPLDGDGTVSASGQQKD